MSKDTQNVQNEFTSYKKRNWVECRYKAPWEEYMESTLTYNESIQKLNKLSRNYDRMNIYNHDIFSIWGANIDYKPIILCHIILKYIIKYA